MIAIPYLKGSCLLHLPFRYVHYSDIYLDDFSAKLKMKDE